MPKQPDTPNSGKPVYHPMVVEKRVLVLYIVGTFLGFIAGFSMAVIIYGVNGLFT